MTTLFWSLVLLGLSIPVVAGNCCDRSRAGYVEFTDLVHYLHDQQANHHYFSFDNSSDNYFVEKNVKIEFRRNHYFLDDYYEPLENRTKVCLYKLYRQHDEIEHMTFKDGTRPKQLVFGCHGNEECCELGCCLIRKYTWFIFIYPFVGTILALSCFARKKRDQRDRLLAQIARETTAEDQIIA
ncbi:hypothetical protein GCK72_016778 [Caenorhabditis remanei]|uniref:CX domain-containing protein n=1 Tax=Caenorhabditis remanei TaxID=31234 RepID=A0A6A5G6A4_CAERE|nr:hypothetical protein GCK72_016778 [Caenorhabditis remanei]KAF1750231.1 hypothetical protein GCK72_016778 [Caenorhabditis remanei]